VGFYFATRQVQVNQAEGREQDDGAVTQISEMGPPPQEGNASVGLRLRWLNRETEPRPGTRKKSHASGLGASPDRANRRRDRHPPDRLPTWQIPPETSARSDQRQIGLWGLLLTTMGLRPTMLLVVNVIGNTQVW